MFTPPSTAIDISDAIQPLLDEALVTRTRAEYAKGRGSGSGDVALHRIGSGYIGLECGRALAYKYHKFPAEERDSGVAPGPLQRHADAGHWTEAKTAEWLRWSGFELKTEHPETGRQFGYKSAPDADGKFRIAGEIDGVILSGPAVSNLPYPWLWESKKATNKKFTKFKKEGVKTADPKYYAQLQTNMLEMEVYVTLFSMLNLDSMEFYFELVRFDPPEAQRLQDRAAKILDSKSPEEFPRITTNEADFRCKFCDYRGACWQENKNPEIQPDQPFWMNLKTK